MEDRYWSLLFDEPLSSERRDAFQKQMEEEPELARAWAGWQQVRSRLRRRLENQLPDRRLLVLYALEQEGHGEALTADERQALEAARADLVQAIDAIPGLERVVERIQDERADFDAAWRRHWDDEASTSQPSPDDRSPRRSRQRDPRRRWGQRLAIAVLLVGVAVAAVFFGWPDASQTTVEVADNEQRIVEFEDGSTVRLRGAATLSYSAEDMSDGARQVSLERGRAFFDVVSQEEAPFVVETPTATTTALGTQFGVATGDDTTGVVLATGEVQVGSSDGASEDAVVLAPGERSTVQRGQPPTPPVPADLTSVLEWSGLFVFRAMPVEEIARRLSTHYDVTISVASALAEEPVTGTFERDQPVDQVLDALAATLGATVQREGDTYRVVTP